MRGKDHLAVGVATTAFGLWGLKAVGAPIEIGTIGVSAMAAGFGALMPDLDHPDSKASNALPFALLTGGLTIAAAAFVSTRFLDRLAGDEAVAATRSTFAPLVGGAGAAIVLAFVLMGLSLAVRTVSGHRGITHSLVFAIGVTLVGSIGCAVFSVPVVYGLAFGWGWLTHLATDAMTPAGLSSLLWPFDSIGARPANPPPSVASAPPSRVSSLPPTPRHAVETPTAAPEPQALHAAIEAPLCPRCGIPMVLRTARRGPRQGQQFYGCANFPRCRQVQDTG